MLNNYFDCSIFNPWRIPQMSRSYIMINRTVSNRVHDNTSLRNFSKLKISSKLFTSPHIHLMSTHINI